MLVKFHITALSCLVLLFIVIPTKDLNSAGDVVLKDLKLKAEALNALKLPVTVKAGFVGTITLKVAFTITGCLLLTFGSLLFTLDWLVIYIYICMHL